MKPLLHATLPDDPARDFVPLPLVFRAIFVLRVGGGSRSRHLANLLDAARRSTGAVSYASLGHGPASHVAVETFARAAEGRMLHVPFKDAGAMLSVVAVGDVDCTAIGINTASGLMASGRLRPIAVADQRRLPTHPHSPSVLEAGVRERAANAGFEITPSTHQAVSERIDADIALYAPLLDEGRIARL